MKENEFEYSIIKKQIENILPYISLSTIANDYFGKTRQWFYQKLNESHVNGKTVKFTEKELVTLSTALYEIGSKMQDVSKTILPSIRKIKGLILDMDLTLIDRESAGNYPDKTEKITIQKYCKKVFLSTILYDSWNEVFTFIRDNNIKVTIVSDAHESIIETVISLFNIPCKFIIGHKAAKGKKKPNPFPMIEALRIMDEASENVLSFGDSLNDYLSASSANINHYGCLWASKEETLLKEIGCKNFISKPQQIIEILKES